MRRDYKAKYTTLLQMQMILNLHEEKRAVGDAMRELSAQQRLLTGTERGKVTRKLNKLAAARKQLDIALVGAPPAPVSPAELIGKILDGIKEKIAKHEESVAEYLLWIKQNPIKGLEFYGGALIRAEYLRAKHEETLTAVLQVMQESADAADENTAGTFFRLHDYWEQQQHYLRRRLAEQHMKQSQYLFDDAIQQVQRGVDQEAMQRNAYFDDLAFYVRHYHDAVVTWARARELEIAALELYPEEEE